MAVPERINITVDGEYPLSWGGGEAYFSLEGSLGGGTYTIQVSQDGTEWNDSNVSFTEAGGEKITVGRNHLLRLNVTGSTAPNAFYSFDNIRQARLV